MGVLRYNIKPFDCIDNVACGDDIEVLWGNAIRDVAVSSFQTGETVVSLSGSNEGAFKIPLVGFCSNFIKGYGSSQWTDVRWANSITFVRYQPAIPYEHYCSNLYEGQLNDPASAVGGINYGTYVNDNGIHGKQFPLGDFENAGYNRALVLATVRRGKRNQTGAAITGGNSTTTIHELQENDNDPLGYEQHIQCWYCRENPSGAGFPPIKILIFDDVDCPVRTEVKIEKTITVPQPTVGTTQKDYILVAVWYNTPIAYNSQDNSWYQVLGNSQSLWVNDTGYNSYNIHPDGLLDINVKLFKEC